MAVTAKQMALIVGALGFISFVFGIFAETKKVYMIYSYGLSYKLNIIAEKTITYALICVFNYPFYSLQVELRFPEKVW